MKKQLSWKAALLTLAMAGAALLTSACGLVTAGVSLPEAFTHNGNLGLRGQLMDDRGQPVDQVIVDVTRDYYLWHADSSYTETTHLTYAADHEFNIAPMRAEELTFKFKKPGYLDTEISVDKDGIKQCECDYVVGGRWPLDTPVRLVMSSAKNTLPYLARIAVPLDFTDPTKMPILDFGQAGGERNGQQYSLRAVRVTTAGEQLPARSLFADVERQPLKTTGKDHQVDPMDINMPATMTLRTGDADGGFVEYTPMAGSHPFSQMGQAPEGGYKSGLVLDEPRLRKMRDTKNEGVMDRNVFFFMKTGGIYGKGMMRWDTDARENLQLMFVMMVQPDGSRDLSSVGFTGTNNRTK